MGKIYDNVIQLIGNTPILHLHKMEEEEGLEANIYAKVEGFNPGGSVKDRAALNMIEAAEKEGKLKPGGRIVEGTSGNTGIGIALVSAVKNYHATICMQEGTSEEKIKILKAYGAEVELTPKNEGFVRTDLPFHPDLSRFPVRYVKYELPDDVGSRPVQDEKPLPLLPFP